MDELPNITILGAGPIGLEAALYARYLGYPVQLLERGTSAAANVSAWGHVPLFTPFAMNASPLGIAALEAQDAHWQCPAPDASLTGEQLREQYWLPLAESDLVASGLLCGVEVLSIGRDGFLKGEGIGDVHRGDAPFRLLLRHADGREEAATADVVLDCTGTFGNHNSMGLGGIPAVGETEAAPHIDYGLPDLLGADKARFAGKKTLVVGAGYSAATVVTLLAELGPEHVTWVTRSPADAPIRHIPNDRLSARDELALRANALASGTNAAITHFAETGVVAVTSRPSTDDFIVELTGRLAGEHTFDRIIANVGYRPDNSIYRELQVHECYATGGPMKLAAQLMGSPSSDCLDQTSGGPDSLRNPEPNFYILGSKSYGRGNQFLLSVGLEQIRDVFTIIGEREDLDLYETMPALRCPIKATGE